MRVWTFFNNNLVVILYLVVAEKIKLIFFQTISGEGLECDIIPGHGGAIFRVSATQL